MKTMNYLLTLLLWTATTIGAISCSEEHVDPVVPPVTQAGIPFALSIGSNAPQSGNLAYALYIFSRSGNTDSYLLDSIIPALNTSTRLKFANKSLSERNYRFLFTACPTDTSGIEIIHSNPHASLQQGTPWENILLVARSSRLSLHNYYKVLDLPGQEILALDSIQGLLTRIVGQMVYQFFKIGTDINDIQPIDDPNVTSVFDRIYKTEIRYEGFTSALSFDASGLPQPGVSPSATVSPLYQTITPELNAQFGVSLPQIPLDTLDGGKSQGGKIGGLYLFPNTSQLQTTLIFHYYDTTPKCRQDHVHVSTCYEEKTLELRLPSTSAAAGLPIRADAFTINKAGIRCNRMIDIGTAHNIEINTEWK